MHENASFLHTHVFIPIGAYVGSTITFGSFVWGWIGTNQPQLTVLFGFGGFMLALISFLRQNKYIKKSRQK
jgi:hypothetical protein